MDSEILDEEFDAPEPVLYFYGKSKDDGKHIFSLNPEDIEHLFEFALEKMPAVHILINGAGFSPTTPIEYLDADIWDWCMNINLRGAHLCVREAIKTMKKQKYGKENSKCNKIYRRNRQP